MGWVEKEEGCADNMTNYKDDSFSEKLDEVRYGFNKKFEDYKDSIIV